MASIRNAKLVFFNGRSNAGGAERMVGYLEDYLQSRGLETEIVDEQKLKNTWIGKLYWKLFQYRHFSKRKLIYMARFASVYAWWCKRPGQFWISNGESTPFFPVNLVISQGCYHVMERAYGRKETALSRIAILQKLGINRAKQVIAVTDQVKRNLVKYYETDAGKISIVANRVDTDYFEVLPKKHDRVKTVLYAGRLENGKGLPLIVDLAETIEKQTVWRLMVACNNAYNTDLFASRKNCVLKTGLGLDNMNREAYSEADVVIFPSLFESFGMITIEALSAGIPVLATPVGIIPDMAARNFPGVYVLHDEQGNELIAYLNKIVDEFSSIDKQQLHEQVREEFGIESYRQRLDEVLGNSLSINRHA